MPTNKALRTWRDIALFLLGAGGFTHEVLIAGTERPTILLGCLALLGVPVFLRKDEGAQAAPAAQVAQAVMPPMSLPESLEERAAREAREGTPEL